MAKEPKARVQGAGRPQLPSPGDDAAKAKGKPIRHSRKNVVFGEKARVMRQARNYSQALLSRELGRVEQLKIDANTISRIERGEQTPILQEVVAYWRFFQADLAWLVDDSAPAADFTPISDASYADIYKLVRSLDPAEARRRLMHPPEKQDLRIEVGDPRGIVNPPEAKKKSS